jgi:hypothetical protein
MFQADISTRAFMFQLYLLVVGMRSEVTHEGFLSSSQEPKVNLTPLWGLVSKVKKTCCRYQDFSRNRIFVVSCVVGRTSLSSPVDAGLAGMFFMLDACSGVLWRFHGHFALVTHWLILAALYYYLRGLRRCWLEHKLHFS